MRRPEQVTPARDSDDWCWRCGVRHTPSDPLPPKVLLSLRTYARAADMRQAAYDLGIAYGTLKNNLRRAYCQLEVTSHIEAFRKMGWLEVD